MNNYVGKILQDDRDFLVEVVDWQGKLAVRKSPKPTTAPDRVKRLENEAYGLQFLADLADKNPALKLYTPKLYEAGSDYIISEYIDAEPVVTAEMTPDIAAARLDKLARLLAGIDRIEPYGEVRFVGHFDYRDIRKNFPKWTKEPLREGLITDEHVKKINSMLDSLIPYLKPRITHGDLLPHSHAFLLPDDRIAWVDLENFTPAGARYYDVANCYNRLFRHFSTPDVAKNFLASFLSFADKADHQEEQLMAVMLQRVAAMQYDAWYDHMKSGEDYKSRAGELLELLLKGELQALI